MGNLSNISNPHRSLKPRPRQLTPKVLFFALAVPIAALIIWLATRTGTMKKAADFGHSVSHPSALLTTEAKPKPHPGKLFEPHAAPAPRPVLNASNRPAGNSAPPTVAQTAPGASPALIAPAPTPALPSSPPLSANRPASAPLSYNAHHDKAFGGCSGQLFLNNAGLQFNCPGDPRGSMQIAVSEISSVDENGVRLTSGKKLHFSIAGMTKSSEQALFTDWFSRLH